MLRYKIRKGNIKSYDKKYDNAKLTSVDFAEEPIKVNIDNHNLYDGDSVLFKKLSGETLIKEDYFNVKKIDKNNIEISALPNITITPSQCNYIDEFSGLDKNIKYSALKFSFLNTPHTFFEVKNDITIKNSIDELFLEDTKENVRMCPGDYIVYNSIYLLQPTELDENGKYIIPLEDLNTKINIFFYKDDEIVYLNDCIIPVTFSGQDNRREILWVFDSENGNDVSLAKYINDNFSSISLYSKNTTYFREKNGELIFNNGCGLYYYVTGINLEIPIGEAFNTNLLKEEKIENLYINNEIEKNINEVVDMEKQIFHPIGIMKNGNVADVINSLVFNLKFRKRRGNTAEAISESWENDNFVDGWYGEDADKMEYLGFTNEEIYYRKNNLKKSFLRLSFYDTNKRSSQSLLYYSTIFLDSNEMYNSLIMKKDVLAKATVYNSFNRGKSSEGYYIYTFPDICKGTEETTLYLKIEFNHAKFGKTIPLFLKKGGGNIPTYYIDENGSGLKKMIEDLYIKVNVKFDERLNKYVWFIPDLKVDENYNINMVLFEPKINKY